MHDLEQDDLKMADQMAWDENIGLENDVPNCTSRHEIAGRCLDRDVKTINSDVNWAHRRKRRKWKTEIYVTKCFFFTAN